MIFCLRLFPTLCLSLSLLPVFQIFFGLPSSLFSFHFLFVFLAVLYYPFLFSSLISTPLTPFSSPRHRSSASSLLFFGFRPFSLSFLHSSRAALLHLSLPDLLLPRLPASSFLRCSSYLDISCLPPRNGLARYRGGVTKCLVLKAKCLGARFRANKFSPKPNTSHAAKHIETLLPRLLLPARH